MTRIKIMNILVPTQSQFVFLCSASYSLLIPKLTTVLLLSLEISFHFLELYINGIIHSVPLIWFLSACVMIVRGPAMLYISVVHNFYCGVTFQCKSQFGLSSYLLRGIFGFWLLQIKLLYSCTSLCVGVCFHLFCTNTHKG